MKRKCQGCAKLFEREDLIKITHSNGEVFINPPSKVLGRSVYVCKNKECIKNLIKKKRITKGLKISKDVSQIEHQLIHNPPF